MEFVKCKNDAEKLQAIANYCNKQIAENDFQINLYRAEQTSPLDYECEINELKVRNIRFQKIIDIIEADEFTSVLLI